MSLPSGSQLTPSCISLYPVAQKHFAPKVTIDSQKCIQSPLFKSHLLAIAEGKINLLLHVWLHLTFGSGNTFLNPVRRRSLTDLTVPAGEARLTCAGVVAEVVLTRTLIQTWARFTLVAIWGNSDTAREHAAVW